MDSKSLRTSLPISPHNEAGQSDEQKANSGQTYTCRLPLARLTKDDYGSEESEESKTPHRKAAAHLAERKRKRNANRSNYSQEITGVLMEWFEQNVDNPYPNEVDRIRMCKATGLSRKQLRVWLINARKVISSPLIPLAQA